MAIGVVFFDVGNTLLYPSPTVAQAFTRVANKRGHAVQLAQIEQHIPAMNAYYDAEYLRDGDFWCSREGSIEIWLDQYRLLCRLAGLEADADGMALEVHRAFCRADHWACFDDVAPCLAELKRRGLRLGVVSNWDAGLESLLAGLGLSPRFDVVVSSAVVGCRKPDAAIFQMACKRLGVSAGECVHVGDRPEADGAGASAAGVRPLIVDRAGHESGCPYDRIRALTDVPSYLDALPA